MPQIGEHARTSPRFVKGQTVNRRFLLDNDGCNVFRSLTEDWERDIRETVEECPPNVTTYLICAGAGTLYFPTQVGVADPKAYPLLKAHAAGGDPFGELIRALRAAGKETFITLRMNDVHNPDAEDQWNTPKVRREHPDCVVDYEAIRRGNPDWMAYCLDYSRAEVQQYGHGIIGELADRYQFDGLQLDWMRFPRHLSGTPAEVWEKREVLTEFTAGVQTTVSKLGARLAARIPTSVAGCRRLGLDIAEWTRRGLVDFLVASPFLTTDFSPPVQDMRRAMGGNPVPLYAAFDFNHATQEHCPESLRAACTSLYECGADGIYVFNFPCWTEYLAARPYHWLTGLDDPETARRKPLLFSVSHRTHRIADVDLPAELPVTAAAGETRLVTLPIPKAALPVKRALLLVHAGGDVAASVNGIACGELPHRRSELFLEYVDRASWERNHAAGLEPRLFRIDPATVKPGENRIEIENRAAQDNAITRVNVGLW